MFEKLLTLILDKLNTINLIPKVQKLFLGFYEVKQLEAVYLTSFLFKPSSFINKNNATNTLHLSHRLKIVQGILAADRGLETFPTEVVYPVTRKCCEASNSD